MDDDELVDDGELMCVFEHPLQAIEEVHSKKKLESGATLYVCRAQKKKERQMELMRKHEAEKMERYNR